MKDAIMNGKEKQMQKVAQTVKATNGNKRKNKLGKGKMEKNNSDDANIERLNNQDLTKFNEKVNALIKLSDYILIKMEEILKK